VIDIGEKLVEILTGNATVGFSLQLLPNLHQILLVFYLSKIVKLFHQLESFLDTQETFSLS
jgi:hypothetical protein